MDDTHYTKYLMIQKIDVKWNLLNDWVDESHEILVHNINILQCKYNIIYLLVVLIFINILQCKYNIIYLLVVLIYKV
jgi:hypothetical protein